MQTIGVDVGGTFTDIAVVDHKGTVSILKVLSTPSDYSDGIEQGIEQLIKEGAITPKEVRSLAHAYTVATNAIITRQGAKVGLITTEGFRDVLEIRRLRMPRLYDMEWEKPVALVPRYLRREVRERIDYLGKIIMPLEMEDVRAALNKLLSDGVDSIAICLLNSYANSVHEQAIAQYIREKAPHINLSVSYEILPEIKEYERTSTTVINAYVKPVVQRYLENLERRVEALGIQAPVMVMQSSGGTVPARRAADQPVHAIESGPAAGAVGAAELGKRLGIPNLISFDMGGTTAKVCLIEDGEPRLTSEYEVGGGISTGHRLLKGAGYLVRVPSIDLAEIGAGGGSIAWIDKGGALRVGPQSAGAEPGPACYLRGGTEPTVTDANVVLGYLNPNYLVGGELAIDYNLAKKAVEEKIGKPLGLSMEETAYGIHTVVNSNMVRAVRAVSSEIGRDPREFALVAFGGNGPVHAAHLAMEARIPSVVIPPAPGVFSALGLLFTTVEHRYIQTFWRDVEGCDLGALNTTFNRLDNDATQTLSSEGFASSEMDIQHLVDMRYAGQMSELTLPVPAGPITVSVAKEMAEAFNQDHDRTYGYRSEEPVQLVNLRLRARGLDKDAFTPDKLGLVASRGLAKKAARAAKRKAYFGQQHRWVDTPVIGRADLKGAQRQGPLLVEEYDTTVVVPPGATASLDDANNIRIAVPVQY